MFREALGDERWERQYADQREEAAWEREYKSNAYQDALEAAALEYLHAREDRGTVLLSSKAEGYCIFSNKRQDCSAFPYAAVLR